MKSTTFSTNNKGMSLIEIMIALTLLTGMAGLGAVFVNRKESQIKKTWRSFTALNRQLDYKARLKRKHYRWAFNLDEDQNSWWVEKKAPEPETAKAGDESSGLVSGSSLKTRPDGFLMDSDFFAKPQTLPRKLTFESVELSHQKELVKSGVVYIPYWPEGQFSTALVLVKYKQKYWSLFFNRLNGEMMVLPGKKSLEDLEQ